MIFVAKTRRRKEKQTVLLNSLSCMSSDYIVQSEYSVRISADAIIKSVEEKENANNASGRK